MKKIHHREREERGERGLDGAGNTFYRFFNEIYR
jgi:hypothetical protein